MIKGPYTRVTIFCNDCCDFVLIPGWEDMTEYEIKYRLLEYYPEWEYVDYDTHYCENCKDNHETSNSK